MIRKSFLIVLVFLFITGCNGSNQNRVTQTQIWNKLEGNVWDYSSEEFTTSIEFFKDGESPKGFIEILDADGDQVYKFEMFVRLDPNKGLVISLTTDADDGIYENGLKHADFVEYQILMMENSIQINNITYRYKGEILGDEEQ